jgi:hypothetical protein
LATRAVVVVPLVLLVMGQMALLILEVQVTAGIPPVSERVRLEIVM